MLAATAVNAEEMILNNIIYSADESTQECTVTGLEDWDLEMGDVVIPAQVTGETGIVYTVTTIEEDAFSDCETITSITFPDTLTEILANAFTGSTSLQTVNFGCGLTTIGDSAFDSCTALTSVTLPESLTSIGEYAFYSCTAMTSADLSACDQLFQEYYADPESVFNGCTSLTTVTLSDNMKTIPARYFGGCTSLQTPLFPDGLMYIETAAFQQCLAFQTVTLPSSVELIDEYAFNGCTGLKQLTLNEGLTFIGDRAFQNDKSLERVNIPSTLTEVGEWVFDCDALKNLYIADLEQWCTLETLTFGSRPNAMATSPVNLYLNNEPLTEINIPAGVTKVTDYAFENVAGITSFTLNEGLEEIGEWAFRALTDATNEQVIIPSTVRTIAAQAFWWNNHAKELVIGQEVEEIGDLAFGSWESLEKITCLNPVCPTVGDLPFSYQGDLDLYVPAEAVETYRADAYWKNFRNIYAIQSDGIGSVENSAAAIYVDAAGRITASGMTGAVTVYDIAGRLIGSFDADGGSLTVTPGAIYIVRNGANTYKLAAK